MKTFPLRSDAVSLAVTETGGHLAEVTFTIGGRAIAPMHTAPWYDEPGAAALPPVIRVLRGDFFCAPFGPSDVFGGEAHGPSASGVWRLGQAGEGVLDLVLQVRIMGATLRKHVELRPGHAVVYQRHVFEGGSGRLPVGHHAMLKAETPLRLGFSPWLAAATPPEPVERPGEGRSILAYPQEISDLAAARRADGGAIDLTTYPAADGHEDLWQLASDPALPLAWTAATASEAGWVWFSLKHPGILPQTTVWLSNGGRDLPPWSGRHRKVIGLEETCSYFHLGHAASIADNPLARRGIPTAITLDPVGEVAIPYMFGLAAVPSGFGAVRQVTTAEGGVLLADAAGREAFAACDPGFLAGA